MENRNAKKAMRGFGRAYMADGYPASLTLFRMYAAVASPSRADQVAERLRVARERKHGPSQETPDEQ